MIKPFTNHTNSKGNIVFRFENLPNNKKDIFDRLESCWLTVLEVDPITKKIISFDCDCPDFQLNRMCDSDCKHLIEAKYLLNTII